MPILANSAEDLGSSMEEEQEPQFSSLSWTEDAEEEEHPIRDTILTIIYVTVILLPPILC